MKERADNENQLKDILKATNCKVKYAREEANMSSLEFTNSSNGNANQSNQHTHIQRPLQ